jgi:ATP phosphoribosyltransferase
MLRIAIQSKGRMHQESLELLDAVGVKLILRDTNSILVRSINFPAEVLFIEKDRIPEFVAQGVVDVGICGEYLARQFGTSDDCILKRLGFNKSTLSLAIPRDIKYKGIEWFMGKTIATPYPELLARYLKTRGVKAITRLMRENVYMAPKVGIAEAICDRVHSGTSLMSENLKEVETVMTSEAILIATPTMTPLNHMILEEFLLRIDAVQAAKGKKFVQMNIPLLALDKVIDILPALHHPSVNSYQDSEYVSVSVVMDEKRLWDILEHLKTLGVKEILITPIDKMIL